MPTSSFSVLEDQITEIFTGKHAKAPAYLQYVEVCNVDVIKNNGRKKKKKKTTQTDLVFWAWCDRRTA